MPIPDLSADSPLVPCCTSWWEIAEALSIIGGEAVRSCNPECADFPYYVSHSVPIGGGDYFVVWISSVAPRNFAQGKMFLAPIVRYTYTVALSLSGHPMPTTSQGGQITAVPSPAEMNHASYFSYSAAQAAYRAIVNQLIATPESLLGPCVVNGIGQLFPQDPAHGSARWGMSFTIDGPITWS